MNQLEVQFVQESLALRARERREAEERHKKQLADAQRLAAAQRRATTRLGWIVAVLAMGLLLAGGAAGLAVQQKQVALRQQQIALSREFAASATSQLSSDPELSVLLAAQAIGVRPTAQSEFALRQSLLESHVRASMRGHTDGVNSAAFSPDGQRVVTASADGTARIYGCEVTCSLGDLLALAQRRITRELTPYERQQYLHETAPQSSS
jgi:hypothetical protein